MSNDLKLRIWTMAVFAALAIGLLFASTASHAGPQPCSTHVAHADQASHMKTEDLAASGSLAEAYCANDCMLCVAYSSLVLYSPEGFGRGPICLEPPSRLHGQLPVPVRHPPRSAA